MRALSLFSVLLCACAGAPTPTPAPEPPPPPPPVEEEPEEEEDPRSLREDATFADLVELARSLDQTTDENTGNGCLIQGLQRGAGRFEGEVAVGLRPLPDAPSHLHTRLSSRAPVQLLSRWGIRGSGELVLAAFTASPPLGDVPEAAVLLTRDQAYVRYVEAEVEAEHAGPFPHAEAAAHLGDRRRVFLTAEAEVPLAVVRQVLEEIDPRTQVVFAVPLIQNTRIPPSPTDLEQEMCSDELPPPGRQGDLSRTQIIESLAPLQEGLKPCLTAGRAESAQGGRMRVLIRVGTEGAVESACVVNDETRDAEVRACVLREIRGLQFPQPRPRGTVDLRLPINLIPEALPIQRSLCD